MDKELLHKVFDREASEEELSAVYRWANENEANKALYLRERALYDCIELNLDEREVRHRGGKRDFSAIWLVFATAAACALIVVSLSFFQKAGQNDPPLVQSVSTGPGQSAEITLPDGSTVCLNSLSTLTYPSDFHDKARVVTLEGEGFFDVTKSGRQFIVKTRYGEILVMGTQFNVEAYDDDEFVTSLLSGSVQVSCPDTSLVLEPNEMVFFQDGKLMRQDIVDHSHLRWREGLICFFDENFLDIAKTLERTYGYDFVFRSDRKYRTRFSGKFYRNDNVTNILKILQTAIDFDFDIDDDHRVIIID